MRQPSQRDANISVKKWFNQAGVMPTFFGKTIRGSGGGGGDNGGGGGNVPNDRPLAPQTPPNDSGDNK
jgi:hypothetical protein